MRLRGFAPCAELPAFYTPLCIASGKNEAHAWYLYTCYNIELELLSILAGVTNSVRDIQRLVVSQPAIAAGRLSYDLMAAISPS